jgi:preprotein translocase subunit SecA
VQYKNRAFEMFRTLLDDMRTGVVNRMFTFQPRDLSTVQTSISTTRQAQPGLPAESSAQNELTKAATPSQAKTSGKRKRRRRRR